VFIHQDRMGAEYPGRYRARAWGLPGGNETQACPTTCNPSGRQHAVMAKDRTARAPADVFESHLALRKVHDLDGDIATNYAEDVVLMTLTGVFRGHTGVRACAAELHRYLPEGDYEYVLRMVEGEVAFLVWTGKSRAGEVHDGADTFLIRDGRIVAQTIHFTVQRPGGHAKG
jgi:hypothetical protein